MKIQNTVPALLSATGALALAGNQRQTLRPSPFNVTSFAASCSSDGGTCSYDFNVSYGDETASCSATLPAAGVSNSGTISIIPSVMTTSTMNTGSPKSTGSGAHNKGGNGHGFGHGGPSKGSGGGSGGSDKGNGNSNCTGKAGGGSGHGGFGSAHGNGTAGGGVLPRVPLRPCDNNANFTWTITYKPAGGLSLGLTHPWDATHNITGTEGLRSYIHGGGSQGPQTYSGPTAFTVSTTIVSS